MKEDLRRIAGESRSKTEARNRIREYLQARILASLQRSGAMIPLAFQGGTALRFLFAIRRFSEDLDFALERPDRSYDFKSYLRAIQGDLAQEGYEVGIKSNDTRAVHSAFVSFPGLLFDLVLSPHRNESLAPWLVASGPRPPGRRSHPEVGCPRCRCPGPASGRSDPSRFVRP